MAMSDAEQRKAASQSQIVFATGEKPIFAEGDQVRILSRSPIGHYRVPHYLRGKSGIVETVIPDDVEVRVSDSTAMVRYLVLPMRPDDAEGFSEDELATLVTRDTMIGVVPVTVGERSEK
jgi:Nitrile hydratase, alpha chain/Nitrile hydratase beta subunit